MLTKQAFALRARPMRFVFSAPAPRRVHLAFTALFFVLSLVVQLPGNVPFDGITVWHQAETRDLYAQHPAALVLIWYLGETLVRGPALFTALQLLSLWSAAGILVARYRPPLWLAGCFYLVLFAFPPLFAFSGVTVKDVFGGHLALLAFVIALPAPGMHNRRAVWFGAFAFGTLATLFRYQFGLILPALAVLMCWQVHRLGESWKTPLLAAAAGVIVTYTIVTLSVFALFTYNGTGDVQLSLRKVMVYDIAGIVVADPDARLAAFERARIDVSPLKAEMRQAYSPERVDSLWQVGGEEMPYSDRRGVFGRLWNVPNSVIMDQWAQSISAHPVALLQHRAAAFAQVLGFGDLYKCRPLRPGISPLPEFQAFEVRAGTYREPVSAQVMESRFFPVGVLFRPWLYVLMSVSILVAGVLAPRMVPREAMLLSGFGLAYEATFFLLPQACEVRYSYPQMLTAVFGTALVAFAWARRRFMSE